MATEAALLGTPSFRFNSFVGPNDMSNFIILQDKYDLMRNVASFEQLIKLITEVLDDKETKNKWLIKRENYFKDREDLNDQIIKNITDN
jgi:predicted glycosyltransferase